MYSLRGGVNVLFATGSRLSVLKRFVKTTSSDDAKRWEAVSQYSNKSTSEVYTRRLDNNRESTCHYSDLGRNFALRVRPTF